MAKLYTGELSNRAANAALQIHGGYGFMDEYAISRLYRDQKILEIGEGTNEVQRMVIARHLGSNASGSFKSGAGKVAGRSAFRQFVDSDLGCASYLIGIRRRPARRSSSTPPSRSSSTSRRRSGTRCASCAPLETHTHADHVSGHGRLALEHDAPVSIHPLADAAVSHDPMVDGDVLQVGDVSVRVLHTPGHRPEHCACSSTRRCCSPVTRSSSATPLGPTSRSGRARAPRASSTACGAWTSFRTTSPVYPGHVAGSLCGAS